MTGSEGLAMTSGERPAIAGTEGGGMIRSERLVTTDRIMLGFMRLTSGDFRRSR